MSDRNANKKFLEALNGADKKGALKALTDACGKDVSIEHLPKPDKSMNSIYALKAKCAAVRAKVQIAANAPDLTESHFVEAALGTYLNAGGALIIGGIILASITAQTKSKPRRG